MNSPKSILITSFEMFCLMLFLAKKQLENEVFFSVNDEDEEKNNKTAAYQNSLYVFIKEQDTMIAFENGKLASNAFQEVIYIMVSLADELFLAAEWEGKKYWRSHLLEYNFFGTNQGGERFLINFENFIKERNSQDSELGLIYLYTLAFGFKGALRYDDDADIKIKELKEKIFYSIYRHSPKLFNKENNVLFEQALENVVIESMQMQDNSLAVLTKIFLICLGVYLVASHVIWQMHTAPAWNVIKEEMHTKMHIEKYQQNSQPHHKASFTQPLKQNVVPYKTNTKVKL